MRYFLIIFLLLSTHSYARVTEEKEVKYPNQVDVQEKRNEYCFILLEKLRIKHNEKGQKFKDGIITKVEWELWLETYFFPRQEAILSEINKFKQNMRKSARFNVDTERDFKTKSVVISP